MESINDPTKPPKGGQPHSLLENSLERGRSKWVFALSVSLPVETKINPKRHFLACSDRIAEYI